MDNGTILNNKNNYVDVIFCDNPSMYIFLTRLRIQNTSMKCPPPPSPTISYSLLNPPNKLL